MAIAIVSASMLMQRPIEGASLIPNYATYHHPHAAAYNLVQQPLQQWSSVVRTNQPGGSFSYAVHEGHSVPQLGHQVINPVGCARVMEYAAAMANE